jgi:hypothetical protein
MTRHLAGLGLLLATLANSALAAAAGEGTAPAPEPELRTSAALHGFAEVSFHNAYITPRGLVVHSNSLAIQPMAGTVLSITPPSRVLTDVSLFAGVWSDLNARQHHPKVGALVELDFFAGVSATLLKDLELGVSYVVFNSPTHGYSPLHNVEFSVAYDDSRYLNGGVFRPYAKLFYNIAGGSVVVLGKTGTFDVELGISPGYTFRGRGKSALSVAIPTYVTLGGPGFFGDGGVPGVVATGPMFSVPLSYLPPSMGAWRIETGATYFRLLNANLALAAQMLGNGDDRDRLVGHLRVAAKY